MDRRHVKVVVVVAFRIFGVLSASKGRTGLKICVRVDLAIPDNLFYEWWGPCYIKNTMFCEKTTNKLRVIRKID